ncbi:MULTISPECIES: ImmA/IrrE family metallo-endopeptidase [unclassified Caballeronia]|uniref:ImmA/IrrE family metallo-endopeptidase n=1 Tax=unclassified Caballeronia TaxID=2646786 RepID=UPI002027A79A|nr:MULTISPECIES: ImmA/IrrE family metallo-endopeptidase [unclassified Caballeronia]
MPEMQAHFLHSKYWNGFLPVDPAVIARKAGVTVEYDPALGDACGRFEIVEGHPKIYINPNETKICQRFVVAHELGHFVLKHGKRFVDTHRQLKYVQFKFREQQANDFALELLIPHFAVDILIEKRNITSYIKLAESFGVGTMAMRTKLKKMGWAP